MRGSQAARSAPCGASLPWASRSATLDPHGSRGQGGELLVVEAERVDRADAARRGADAAPLAHRLVDLRDGPDEVARPVPDLPALDGQVRADPLAVEAAGARGLVHGRPPRAPPPGRAGG